jgi:hypothetical protein
LRVVASSPANLLLSALRAWLVARSLPSSFSVLLTSACGVCVCGGGGVGRRACVCMGGGGQG